MTRRLTALAQEDRNDFKALFGEGGNCSCHINPPCSSCMHTGNPISQDEDPTCWEEIPHGQIAICSKRKGGTPAPEGFTVVDVDRGTPLGNPHLMMRGNDEAERNRVCDLFRDRFLFRFNASREFKDKIIELVKRVRAGENIALRCWCAPKRCHAETIKTEIERRLDA